MLSAIYRLSSVGCLPITFPNLRREFGGCYCVRSPTSRLFSHQWLRSGYRHRADFLDEPFNPTTSLLYRADGDCQPDSGAVLVFIVQALYGDLHPGGFLSLAYGRIPAALTWMRLSAWQAPFTCPPAALPALQKNFFSLIYD